MEFRILGPLEVLESGAPVELGGQKQRALLAMLLLHANEVVSTDRLIDALWEDDPPRQGAKSDSRSTSPGCARCSVRPYRDEGAGLSGACRRRRAGPARFEAFSQKGVRDALALWRGPALGDFVYSRFAATEIARLEELRLSALEGRIRAGSGRWSSSRGCRRARGAGARTPPAGAPACPAHARPLSVRSSGRLPGGLSGRSQVAHRRLGLEPSRKLRELQQAILRHDPALDRAVPLASPADSPRGFFVGRERELTALLEGLDDAFAGNGRLFLFVASPGSARAGWPTKWSSQARSRGAEVLVGRSWEAGGAPAYWPWVQALRAYVERGNGGGSSLGSRRAR